MIKSYQVNRKKRTIICILESDDQTSISIADYCDAVKGKNRYIDLELLNQLYNDLKNSYLFSPVKYIIQYRLNGEFKHYSFPMWHSAYEQYCKMVESGIYENIYTNFDIEYTIESAANYNKELIKNTNYDNKNIIINRSININLLD